MITNDLDIELQEGKHEFIGYTININDYLSFNILNYIENINQLRFINCTFNGDLEIQDFRNQIFKLFFKDCTFNGDIVINNIEIDCLHFINTKKIKTIHIDGLFNRFRFNNKDIPLSGRISIFATILKELNLDNFFLENGNLDLVINNSEEYDYKNCSSTFQNAIISEGRIDNSYFGDSANFRNLKILDNLVFDGCKFNKSSFKLTSFGNFSNFNDCKFYSYTGFEECKNLENTNLKVSACLFESFPHFNGSEFNHLEISRTTFEKKVSFDSTIVNSLKINQVTFLQGAYFDDVKINKIDTCDRRTIRTIKQELQKAENRIDFNRFRAYELAAHYEELDWKWNSGFIDKSILFASKISTDFGNSWRKALRFTLLFGLAFYLFLYSIENRYASINISNWDNWSQLLSGFFRFLLITDFYNPLETERFYLTNPLSWMILIFGKIVVAFGIYEMIQSFRKFKA